LSQNGQRGSLLVCDWLHSIGKNHFYVMLLINHGCCLYSESSCRLCALRRLCADFKIEKLNPLYPSGRPCHPFGRSSIKQHLSGRCGYSVWTPSVSRSFELFKVASVWTSQQHVQTPFSVRQEKGFPSQTQIWEDNCNHLDNKYTPSGPYPW
jgi:hypothetical protein